MAGSPLPGTLPGSALETPLMYISRVISEAKYLCVHLSVEDCWVRVFVISLGCFYFSPELQEFLIYFGYEHFLSSLSFFGGLTLGKLRKNLRTTFWEPFVKMLQLCRSKCSKMNSSVSISLHRWCLILSHSVHNHVDTQLLPTCTVPPNLPIISKPIPNILIITYLNISKR